MSYSLEKSKESHTSPQILSDNEQLNVIFILNVEILSNPDIVLLVTDIKAYCEKYNLNISPYPYISKGHIQVTGSVIDFKNAFGVEKYAPNLYHTLGNNTYIPIDWKNKVVNILGLDIDIKTTSHCVLNNTITQSLLPPPQPGQNRRRLVRRALGQSTSTPTHSTLYQYPTTIARIYNFPLSSCTGVGQKIGIIELGGGFRITDVTNYLTSIGVTFTGSINVISVNGGQNLIAIPTPADPNPNAEVYLDVEIVAAIASGATINVYFAQNTPVGYYNAFNIAISDNCKIISTSWGAPEVFWGSSYLNAFNNLFARAISVGCTIFAAAGDNGSSDGSSGNNVDFPASSPYVIGCGGTHLPMANNTDSVALANEIVWNNSTQSATGGGVSTYFSKPLYQSNIATSSSSNFRLVPDIAGCADPNTGYYVTVSTGGPAVGMVIGGTSAVSPLWAAFLALATQRLGKYINCGDLQNLLYQYPVTIAIPKICNDIVSGNNGTYSAGIRYDACTGNGTPNGNNIISALSIYTVRPTALFNVGTISSKTVTFSIINFNPTCLYYWTFGDNTTSRLFANISHTYAANGTYAVTLTAVNSYGSSTSGSIFVVIESTPIVTPLPVPVASFTIIINSYIGIRPQTVLVTLTNTSINSTLYLWNFGDNTTSSTTSSTLTHTYTVSGMPYLISLTASNGISNSIASINVTI
jgi:kumamolisin